MSSEEGGEGAVRNPLPIMAFIHIYISLLLENIFVGWWY